MPAILCCREGLGEAIDREVSTTQALPYTHSVSTPVPSLGSVPLPSSFPKNNTWKFDLSKNLLSMRGGTASQGLLP